MDGPQYVRSEVEVDTVKDWLQKNKSKGLACKLRDFILTILVMGAPPIVVALVAKGSKDSMQTLCDMHFELIDLLHQHDIHPLSLSADSIKVERSLQRLIASKTHSHHEAPIANWLLLPHLRSLQQAIYGLVFPRPGTSLAALVSCDRAWTPLTLSLIFLSPSSLLLLPAVRSFSPIYSLPPATFPIPPAYGLPTRPVYARPIFKIPTKTQSRCR
ncbi:hypothetical protein OF83DRAFT_1175979 [Amylostereum chailletii]|nr:hypothetical protein OF83DRAFT_1175979 [Amylostereum chailletii]